MGMIEEARVNLDAGGSEALLKANAQASIAVAESLHDVVALLTAAVKKAGDIDAALMLLNTKD